MCSSIGVSGSADANVSCIVTWLLKYPREDKILQEAYIRASGLPAVFVRPTRLTDLPPRGLNQVVAVERGTVPYQRISRADVAAFMIAQI